MSAHRLAEQVTPDDHAQGSPDALVTLVQYGDYECPYTRLSRHSVHALQREFAAKLRFVFRHFPLRNVHPHAQMAAETAEAVYALAGGDAFWVMHDGLFAHQDQLDGKTNHIHRDEKIYARSRGCQALIACGR